MLALCCVDRVCMRNEFMEWANRLRCKLCGTSVLLPHIHMQTHVSVLHQWLKIDYFYWTLDNPPHTDHEFLYSSENAKSIRMNRVLLESEQRTWFRLQQILIVFELLELLCQIIREYFDRWTLAGLLLLFDLFNSTVSKIPGIPRISYIIT